MTVARDRSQALFGIFFQGRRPACSSPSVIEECINPQAYDCAEEGNCNKAAPGISANWLAWTAISGRRGICPVGKG